MQFPFQPLVQAISVIASVLAVVVVTFCLKIRGGEFIGCAFKSFGRAWVDLWLK
ncbi:MAG: hypothetical protein ACFFCZ_12695 [Promethearchaeota archaeon]